MLDFTANDAEVKGAGGLYAAAQRLSHLQVAARLYDGQVGDAEKNAELLIALMRRSRFAGEEPCVRSQYLHIEIAVGHADVELIHEATAEGVEGARKGHVTFLGHAGRHGNQVLLGDAAFYKFVGMIVVEDVQPRRAAQIGVQRHDILVLVGQIGQGITHLVAHLLSPGSVRQDELCHRMCSYACVSRMSSGLPCTGGTTSMARPRAW